MRPGRRKTAGIRQSKKRFSQKLLRRLKNSSKNKLENKEARMRRSKGSTNRSRATEFQGQYSEIVFEHSKSSKTRKCFFITFIRLQSFLFKKLAKIGGGFFHLQFSLILQYESNFVQIGKIIKSSRGFHFKVIIM